jgi:protein-disulfide isomerase
MNSTRITLITILIAVAAVAALIVVPRLGGGAEAPVELDISGRPMLGNPDAPVTMVVFEDFRCPGCQNFELNVFPELERDYVASGQVRVVAMSFPVVSPVAASEHVARVAKCVHQQSNDAYWEMKPPLYRALPELGNERRVIELALLYAPGIDAGLLDACLADPASLTLVQNDSRMGTALEVRATPTVMINGVAVSSPSASAVRAAIDAALRN